MVDDPTGPTAWEIANKGKAKTAHDKALAGPVPTAEETPKAPPKAPSQMAFTLEMKGPMGEAVRRDVSRPAVAPTQAQLQMQKVAETRKDAMDILKDFNSRGSALDMAKSKDADERSR